MRILIIGGTRFVGAYLVKQLLESGHNVTVFHRGQTNIDVPGGFGRSVRRLYGDCERIAEFADQFALLRPDVVVGMYLMKEEDAVSVMQVFKGIAGRVIAISSMDVYLAYGKVIGTEQGEPDEALLTEDSPLRTHLYPYRNRAKGEDDLLYYYDKIPVEQTIMSDPELPGTVLRLPFVYGPLDYQHRLFEYLKRMDDGRPAILLNQAKYDFQWTRGYVENVAQAIALATTDSRSIGRIYNVGEENALSEAEWVRAIGDAAGWKGRVIALPDGAVAEDRTPASLREPYHFANHLAADTSRIRTELGFKEAVSREEALKRTVEWERANPPAEVDLRRFDYSVEDEVLAALNG